MARTSILLVLIALSGCSVMAPAQQMPAFGAQFEPTLHTQTVPDAATLIVYRAPDVEEVFKPLVMVFGIEPFRANRPLGNLFDGAFLRADWPAGQVRLNVMPQWWEEDPPAGQSFLGRMNIGEPPSEGLPIRATTVPLEISIEAGAVTYVKLTRSVRSELTTCGETAETASICRMNIVTTALEQVPPETAQSELAGLREAVDAGEER